MRFDLITIFPEFFSGPLDHGIVRRAKEAGLMQIHIQDLREFTKDKHRTVDDRPFGGGEGMVLKPEPLFEAVEGLGAAASSGGATSGGAAVVLLSASGKLFRQRRILDDGARSDAAILADSGSPQNLRKRFHDRVPADSHRSIASYSFAGVMKAWTNASPSTSPPKKSPSAITCLAVANFLPQSFLTR